MSPSLDAQLDKKQPHTLMHLSCHALPLEICALMLWDCWRKMETRGPPTPKATPSSLPPWGGGTGELFQGNQCKIVLLEKCGLERAGRYPQANFYTPSPLFCPGKFGQMTFWAVKLFHSQRTNFVRAFNRYKKLIRIYLTKDVTSLHNIQPLINYSNKVT